MLKKETKIRIIENFLSLDYLFFGKSIHEMNINIDIAKQYIELKGSMGSIISEIYSVIDHSPEEISEVLKESDIENMAMKSAITARQNVKKLLTSADGKSSVTAATFLAIRENEEANIDEIVHYKIQEKAFQLGMDNLIIARSLSESTNPEIMKNFEGKILEDSYKCLRDSLIETALVILENN